MWAIKNNLDKKVFFLSEKNLSATKVKKLFFLKIILHPIASESEPPRLHSVHSLSQKSCCEIGRQLYLKFGTLGIDGSEILI